MSSNARVLMCIFGLNTATLLGYLSRSKRPPAGEGFASTRVGFLIAMLLSKKRRRSVPWHSKPEAGASYEAGPAWADKPQHTGGRPVLRGQSSGYRILGTSFHLMRTYPFLRIISVFSVR